jgi:hypothetical protein
VPRVGIEPTMAIGLLIYSQVQSPVCSSAARYLFATKALSPDSPRRMRGSHPPGQQRWEMPNLKTLQEAKCPTSSAAGQQLEFRALRSGRASAVEPIKRITHPLTPMRGRGTLTNKKAPYVKAAMSSRLSYSERHKPGVSCSGPERSSAQGLF